MIVNLEKYFIGGKWVEPVFVNPQIILNPATEEPFACINLGSFIDVDRAVSAARSAFPAYSATTREDRVELLHNIISCYRLRTEEIAVAITEELGCPIQLSRNLQAVSGIAHLETAIETLKNFAFEETIGKARVYKEPIGVCGLITPWNWPINQIVCKLAPALAVGCTMVLKPSELTPVSATILAEILEEAGVPAGVFNMVQGNGPTVGHALASHPQVDMVSITGSVQSGIAVAVAAAPTVKRVIQELGGKAANIVLDDAEFEKCVKRDTILCFLNSGQGCNLPTRMLVPKKCLKEVVSIVKAAAQSVIVGDPNAEDTTMGPVVSQLQWDRIQGYIRKGIDEGATLVCGGTGRPHGFEKGYYVRPTVFCNVTKDMTIAREEIFGPVLSIIEYQDERDAIRMANDSQYGLSGFVSSGDNKRALDIAHQLKTGMVYLNGAHSEFAAPFGGYKMSGNGREWGEYGFQEFLETKAITGWEA